MKASVLALLTAVLLAGGLMVASFSAIGWEARAVLHYPSPAYPDTTYTFTIDIKNTGSDSMQLQKLGLRFDWDPDDYYHPVSGLPDTIGSGGTSSYTISLHIPAGITTNTYHIATVYIQAADPFFGGWGIPSYDTHDYPVYISQTPPSGTTGGGGGPPSGTTGGGGGAAPDNTGLFVGLAALAIVLAVVVVAVVVVMQRRKKPQQMGQMAAPVGYQQPPPPGQYPSQQGPPGQAPGQGPPGGQQKQ